MLATLCIAKGFGGKEDVQIYDSLRNAQPSNQLLNNISRLLGCKSSFSYVIKKPTRQNAADNSCGVYALAFATALCFGEEVETLNFANQISLRQHLKKTLLANPYRTKEEPPIIEPFPLDGKRAAHNRDVPVTVDVCGICGEVMDHQSSNQMIACDNCEIWYHRKCDNVPEELFDKKNPKWSCSNCKNQRFAKSKLV